MTEATGRAAAMVEGRRVDTTRRRQRVLTALAEAAAAGDEITVSAIAQRAGVDRSFFYRHRATCSNNCMCARHSRRTLRPGPSP